MSFKESMGTITIPLPVCQKTYNHTYDTIILLYHTGKDYLNTRNEYTSE